MTRDKYALKSTKKENGKIIHSYSGRINHNASTSEPHMYLFKETTVVDDSARTLEDFHEDYLKKDGIETITTIVIGEKIGRPLITRGLDRLKVILEN